MDAEKLAVFPENEAHVTAMLRNFVRENSDTSLPSQEFKLETKRLIIECLQQWLQTTYGSKALREVALQTIKILSREKVGMESLCTERAMALLLKLAGLHLPILGQEEEEEVTSQDSETVMLEAQKCLCNIIFQQDSACKICSVNGCIEAILHRMTTYKDPQFSLVVKYYDMRILFVITAKSKAASVKLLKEIHGLIHLTDALHVVLKECQEVQRPMVEEEHRLCVEVLKTLFNITCTTDKSNVDEDEKALYRRLISVLRDIIIKVASENTKETRDEMISHCVNLLTNMPLSSFDALYVHCLSDNACAAGPPSADQATGSIFKGKDMTAVIVLLSFLDERLDTCLEVKSTATMNEKILPVISALYEMCQADRLIRKFCRLNILPFLGEDVKKLPTEGDSLKAKMITQMTSVNNNVKELVSEFCFLLCRRNVGRFVKYAGYGNAAGFLAKRGLLSDNKYLSDSEDSETEEYRKVKEDVNYITGRWEDKKNAPKLPAMSEEQKVYETIQLVNTFDKLTRDGLIQPCVIEDGRPRPVDSVGELCQNLRLSESDSD